MSDLQKILIIIGALIIVAVLLFNWWQERKFNQQVERSFSKLQDDALLKKEVESTSNNVFEEDGFSIDSERFEEDFADDGHYKQLEPNETANRLSPENSEISLKEDITEVIDSTYSTLLAKQSQSSHTSTLENANDTTFKIEGGNHVEDANHAQPTQHEEIKAIFNDAFNQNIVTPVAAIVSENIHHLNDDLDHQNASIIEPIATTLLKEAQAKDTQDKATPVNDVTKSSLPAMLQSQMDLIAIIYLANETNITSLVASISSFFDDYDKPIHLHVLINETDWLPLTLSTVEHEMANKLTTKISCSLQLADRAGAVTRSVLNRFQLAVETLGLDVDGHVEWQSNGDALLAASALDAFCIDVDKTMGFHLIHGENGAFTGTKLRGVSESQGLVLDADGTFKYHAKITSDSLQTDDANQQSASFVMFNRDNYPFSPDMLRNSVVKAVTFQLDIPHVMHCTEAFNHMVNIARHMETTLNAVLVDDNNRPLGDMQIEKIRQQLKVIYATMLVRGIVPGSDSAHRLFS